MDGNTNPNHHQYMMNFGSMSQTPQQSQQQASQLHQQDYAQLFFNQQNYINNLNMPILYNQPAQPQQSMDIQALQRQQLLQALKNPHQQITQPAHIAHNEQNIAQSNVTQHLQQQLYASSVQFQNLQQQHQQPTQLNPQHLSAQQIGQFLQNGGNILQANQVVLQQQQRLHSQQQQQFQNKPTISYSNTTAGVVQSPSTSSCGIVHPQPQHQQLHQQQQFHTQLSHTSPMAAQSQILLQQQQLHLTQKDQVSSSRHPSTAITNRELLQEQLQQHHQFTQQQHPNVQQQQHPSYSKVQVPTSSAAVSKRTPTTEPLIQSPYALPSFRRSKEEKSSPFNANIENARLLKEREDELLLEKNEQEAREKQRIQEELKRKKEDAKEFAESFSERVKTFPEPLHLATCHTLSKVSAFLPFPSECAATSSNLPCFDEKRASTVLENNEATMAQYLAEILADTTDDVREIELKHEEEEINEIESELLAPLVQSVLNFNSTAFHVEPSEFGLNEMEQAFGKDIQEAVKHVSMDADTAAIAAATAADVFVGHDQPCSSVDYNAMESTNGGAKTLSVNTEEINMRQQMVSVGKQPKAASNRKKRDMVESLYDSLTGYFDPSKDRRNRRGTRPDDREDSEAPQENPDDTLLSTIDAVAVDASASSTYREPETTGKFYERRNVRKRQKQSEGEENRPPTPTEIIQQREQEWFARQQMRQEKIRRRQIESDLEWNNDAMAEDESYCKFTNFMDQILDQLEDSNSLRCDGEGEIPRELLIDKNVLDELRIEAQKLKSWRKINKVNTDRLVELLTVLEKNVSDVLNDDGSLAMPVGDVDDEADDAYREIIDERLLRSVDASCVALIIMTSPKMPKQVFIEDTIERSIQLCKQYLHHIIYPTADSSFKSPVKSKKKCDNVKRRRLLDSFSPFKVTLYSRLVDLIGYFAELARFQKLNETLIVQLASLATPPFFVDNVPELQVESIKLLSTIFSESSSLRQGIINDLLNSLYRLPTNRNSKSSYNLGGGEYVSNFTVLVLQLIQSTVKLPQPKKNAMDESDDGPSDSEADGIVLDSYEEAKRRIAFFLERFLAKCTAKSEDDYRRLFELFLQDVLLVLYRPEWPVAELVLTVLANLLIMFFRSKSSNTMLSLRVASLDYLGTITARLRRDRVLAESLARNNFEQTRLDLVVRGIVYDEMNDMTKTLDDIDISHLSSNEKLRKLEQALIDYIIYTKGDGDVSVEYVVTFYVVEWYRGTVLDVRSIKEKYQETVRQMERHDPSAAKQMSKHDRKLEKIIEKGANMKEFILSLLDKRHLKKRAQFIQRTGNVMIDSDAQWVVKYLALKKEDLAQSFDIYLKHILEGFHPDLPVAVRAKAMKCLTQIVEVDSQVLMNGEVDKIVRDRLVDANAAVREAAFELIGKYLVIRPELLKSFYSLLLNRIKDTAVAVRKRVIRILKDIVDKQPNLEQKPEILSRIVQRINDEEGVRKLCLETFQSLWFWPNSENEKHLLKSKVISMADVVDVCVRDGIIEQFESLIVSILKKCTDYETILASRQIVDSLVDYVISLDSKIANDEKNIEDVDKLEQKQLDVEKTNQARLLASLSTLSVFAKARPDLLVQHAEVFLPYLSMQVSSNIELRVLNQMITMLEQIIPLVEHPSEQFLRMLDSRLNDIIRDGGMVIIASAIACMSAAYEKFQKVFPGICSLFITYLKYLSKVKQENESNPSFELQFDKKPIVMRGLYTLGLAGRYFDFDNLLGNQSEHAATLSTFAEILQKGSPKRAGSAAPNEPTSLDEDEEDATKHVLRDQMFSVLLYFSRIKGQDPKICEKALIALGQLTAGRPELLRRQGIKKMYLALLNTDRHEFLQLKVQVLRNLFYFLNAEETRALKRNEQYAKQHGIQKNDLKEMDLSSSGLSSSVIQVYWNAILSCYFYVDELVRTEVAQVIWQTLEQGLVTPGSSIPSLIAISTDPISSVRIRISNLIKDIDMKYTGMVASKAIPGVRMAYRLHKKIYENVNNKQTMTEKESNNDKLSCLGLIRGIRASAPDGTLTELSFSNDVQSLLMGLYVGIRMNRQQRRSFLSAILQLFSENVKEPLELNELSFVADNLAHFPYQVMDEPLYVIYQADSIISISGQNVLSNFKAILKPSQHKRPPPQLLAQQLSGGDASALPSASNNSLSTDDDEDDFTEESLINRFPDDITKVKELREQSLPCFFLLHLKFYLMRMYGFSKDRLQEYSPSEAAKLYEKPMNRRNIAVFSPDALMRHLEGTNTAAAAAVAESSARWKLAEHFRSLFQMLLSLDKGDEEDEENSEMTATNAELVTNPNDEAEKEESIVV